MRTRNVEHVKRKIENQLCQWSKRSLTTLGKILIVKTFGVSQIIYLLQSMTLENVHFKRLNEILYRFIWNKHFHAAKAPERINREIVTTPIKFGGLGMLDIVELDKGLKLRALGRLFVTEHPALKLIKNKLDLSDFFFPKLMASNIDSFVGLGLALLREDRQSLWGNVQLKSDLKFLTAIRESKIINLVKKEFRNNLALYMLNRAGKVKVRDLEIRDLAHVGQLLNENVKQLVGSGIALRLPSQPESDKHLYLHNGKWVNLGKLTSKEIRDSRSKALPICIYKCGLILDLDEGGRWLNNLKQLESTGHKNALLRFFMGTSTVKAGYSNLV